MPTQVDEPWQAVIRTVFQAAIGLAALAVLWEADAGTPASVVTALAVCAAVTRVMALPAVNDWIDDYAPWLSARK